MKLSDIMDVNVEAERVHVANRKWWVDLVTGEPIDRDKDEQLMLVITELSEAMEGARKDKMDDHLPQYKMEHVEIIDAFIRMLDYRHGHGIREPFTETTYFNENRSYGFKLFGMCGTIVDISDNGYLHTGPIDFFLSSLFAYAIQRGFSDKFLEIYNAKMAYNATRIDHTREHRLADGGKKV